MTESTLNLQFLNPNWSSKFNLFVFVVKNVSRIMHKTDQWFLVEGMFQN